MDHDGTGNALVHTTCEDLLPDGSCQVYETRPEIGRHFPNDSCEPNTGEPAGQVLLRTAEDLENWMRLTRMDVILEQREQRRGKRGKRRHGKGRRSGRNGRS